MFNNDDDKIFMLKSAPFGNNNINEVDNSVLLRDTGTQIYFSLAQYAKEDG